MKSKKGFRPALLRYSILILAIIVLFFILRAFFNSRDVVVYNAPMPVVEIQKPEHRDMESVLLLNGHIEAEVMIPVVPFVNGTIVEYNIKPGDYVEKDLVLAMIDSEPFEFQMAQAKASYLGYQSTFDRVSALHEAGAVTQQEYDTVSAQRDAAKAQYELAKLQLSYAEVKSPVAGTVLTAPLSVGSIGSTQQPVAVLGSLDDLVVRLQVPERYFDLFLADRDSLEAYVIRQTETDLVVKAEIETISPYIEPTAKTFEVKFRLKEKLDEFRPGMYIKAKLVYERLYNVPCLPQRARKLDGSVYLFDEETGTVSWLEIEPEIESNEYFSVPDEYSGRFFVVSGQNSLIDGEPVRVKGNG